MAMTVISMSSGKITPFCPDDDGDEDIIPHGNSFRQALHGGGSKGQQLVIMIMVVMLPTLSASILALINITQVLKQELAREDIVSAIHCYTQVRPPPQDICYCCNNNTYCFFFFFYFFSSSSSTYSFFFFFFSVFSFFSVFPSPFSPSSPSSPLSSSPSSFLFLLHFLLVLL